MTPQIMEKAVSKKISSNATYNYNNAFININRKGF